MHVGINKTCCERMSLTIDDASRFVFEGLHSFICPHIKNAIPFDCHRLRLWMCFVAGEDFRVRNDDIGRWHDSLLENVVTTLVVVLVKRATKVATMGFC